MPENNLIPARAAIGVAALLACSAFISVHADEGGDQTPGVETSVPRPPHAKGNPPSWAGKAFRQGVVAVANPYGAEAGAQILEQGGNAIDAAVAIAYALNVVEPQSAGIGGGGFMMIHLAKIGQTFVIETREKAPGAATANMFVGVPTSTLQGVAVGVPGMVRGTSMALERFGKLTLAEVIQPAIKLADQGFAATPRYTAVSCNNGGRSTNSPESAAYFCPGGQPVPVGSLVQNKPLADTFRLLAANGPDCFYKLMPEKGCDIAAGIVEGQKFNRPQAPNGKGSMTLADLENYQANIRQPVVATYRGYTIKAMSPPSSGGLTMLQMLKMLERFPIGDASQGYGFGSLKTTNVLIDAMRIGFADRSQWMGDADFVPVPAKGLLAPGYVSMRGAAIVPGLRLMPNPIAGDPRPYDIAGIKATRRLAVAEPVTGPGETTTHFSVVDKWGNMVTYTNTIESSHGIGVFAGYKRSDGSFRNHGFLLNNELTDFNTAPTTNPYTGSAGFNDVQPNKRPRSSMNPTMIFSPDGTPLVAYGSPGGASIINSVLNVTINLIDHKMSLQDAIDAPRLSVTSTGSTVSMEPGFSQATIIGLQGMGYTVGITPPGGEIGSVQAVIVDAHTGKQYGAADSRREGTVIGLPRQ
ncbi:gamma-glutamyltransferase [Variovorax rhizosphaerae]|uniref:Glutathione hydrolase proenzyme n=1 Tax=Variovorax rhizosphaerae TaxID=1836200 RepID=A0ABU8WY55_9BURK